MFPLSPRQRRVVAVLALSALAAVSAVFWPHVLAAVQGDPGQALRITGRVLRVAARRFACAGEEDPRRLKTRSAHHSARLSSAATSLTGLVIWDFGGQESLPMSEVQWTEVSAAATAVTAVISLAALLAVAWQSFLTRSGVDVSQAVLLAGDRGRLDDRAPEVSVRLEEPTWPLLAWSHLGMPCNPWPNNHDWHFPEREDQRTVFQAAVVLENLSNRAVEARFEGDFAVAAEDNRVLRAPSPIIVPARDDAGTAGQVRVFLQAEFTAKELSENYEAREQGRPLPHQAAGTISVRDDRDNGTTDTWDLSLTGCPI